MSEISPMLDTWNMMPIQVRIKLPKRRDLSNSSPWKWFSILLIATMRIWQQLNVLSPSIEPKASGHIIEQIEMIRKILEAGFAYEVNGSVYFDVAKYNQNHNYGILSGRVLEDLDDCYP